MAIGIHFDNDAEYYNTLNIGIGHRDEDDDEYDNLTMGIGIGHRTEKTDEVDND